MIGVRALPTWNLYQAQAAFTHEQLKLTAPILFHWHPSSFSLCLFLYVHAFKVCHFPANSWSANASCMTFEILPVKYETNPQRKCRPKTKEDDLRILQRKMLLLAHKFKNSTWVKTQRSLQCPAQCHQTLEPPLRWCWRNLFVNLIKARIRNLKNFATLKALPLSWEATSQQQLPSQTQTCQVKAG